MSTRPTAIDTQLSPPAAAQRRRCRWAGSARRTRRHPRLAPTATRTVERPEAAKLRVVTVGLANWTHPASRTGAAPSLAIVPGGGDSPSPPIATGVRERRDRAAARVRPSAGGLAARADRSLVRAAAGPRKAIRDSAQRRPALAGSTGAGRRWTVSMISDYADVRIECVIWTSGLCRSGVRDCPVPRDVGSRVRIARAAETTKPVKRSLDRRRQRKRRSLVFVERGSNLHEPFCAQLSAIRQLVLSVRAPGCDHRKHQDSALPK
jgi:hypothetical protein